PLVRVGGREREPALHLDELAAEARPPLTEVSEPATVAHRRGVGLEQVRAEGNEIARVLEVVQLELRTAVDAPIRLPQRREPRRLLAVHALGTERTQDVGKEVGAARRARPGNRGDASSGGSELLRNQPERLLPGDRLVAAGAARPCKPQRRAHAIRVVENLRAGLPARAGTA